MKRFRHEGRIRRGPLSIEWGESIKRLKHEVTAQIGNLDYRPGPRWYIRVRMGIEPSHWRKPHNAVVHIEIGCNRIWIFEFNSIGAQYADEAP